MPPAAKVYYYDGPIEEDPVSAHDEIGGIEVQVSRDDLSKSGMAVTRIVVLPHSAGPSDLQLQAATEKSGCREHSFEVLPDHSSSACLADSFDSADEIPEDSNDARLIKILAQKADSLPYNPEADLGDRLLQSGANPPYDLDETEARYLGLGRGAAEGDAHHGYSMHGYPEEAFRSTDDPHPNQYDVPDVLDSLLEVPCCECVHDTRSLPSALRPSRWTASPYGAASAQGVPPAAEIGTPRSRSVTFKEVAIKEFDMTLGNHPSATSGPPVMLDWNSRPRSQTISLEQYEQAREPRRNRRQLKLSLQQRHGILVKERGFSFDQVKSAWQEALEIRKQRKETLERGLAMMKWDEVWESTCRKFNRLVDAAL